MRWLNARITERAALAMVAVLVAIEGAKLILRHGIELDSWLDDTLRAGAGATVVTVTDGITLAPGAEFWQADVASGLVGRQLYIDGNRASMRGAGQA